MGILNMAHRSKNSDRDMAVDITVTGRRATLERAPGMCAQADESSSPEGDVDRSPRCAELGLGSDLPGPYAIVPGRSTRSAVVIDDVPAPRRRVAVIIGDRRIVVSSLDDRRRRR